VRIIEEQAVRAAVGPAEALAAAERAFRALGEGTAVQPTPLGLDVPPVSGEVHVKGAYLTGSPVFALKVATGFYQNTTRGLPSGAGLFLIFDATTGFPLALLRENGYLTDLRTGAAGALAARHLAPEHIGMVAVLGSGIQARLQLTCLALTRRFDAVRAWSPTREHLERYCAEMEGELGVPLRVAAGPEEAVRGADLVITATPSRRPLVRAHWLAPHATVIAVGSDGPEKQELSAECLARADKVVADRVSQCVALGEIHHAVAAGLLDPSRVYAELGDIVTGRKPGREGDELIVCDLTGVGAQDAAIAEAAWRRLGGPEGGGAT
jgi:ornithine cyclodeaminase/alanine dehydrogenase-like protein (mu-crystallin family)